MFEDLWRWSPRVLEQSQLAVQRALEIVPKAAGSLGELVMLAGLPEVGLAAAGKGGVLVVSVLLCPRNVACLGCHVSIA